MAICAICLKDYSKQKTTQIVCSPPCALIAARAKRKAKESKEARAEARAWKKSNKTLSELAADAQVDFNKYIRVRDEHIPCYCGKSPYSGQRHCSHFRPRSTSSQHRFNTLNCVSSCQPCNTHLSGNLTVYRIALVKKLGEARVQALENDNRTVKYTREYLERLKLLFRARTKHLIRLRARINAD